MYEDYGMDTEVDFEEDYMDDYEYEDDGQPDEYTEWQDWGDDCDQGQFDSE